MDKPTRTLFYQHRSNQASREGELFANYGAEARVDPGRHRPPVPAPAQVGTVRSAQAFASLKPRAKHADNTSNAP